MKSFLAFFAASLLAVSAVAADSDADGPDLEAGQALYEQSCAACHGTGAAGAPKVGDKDDWAPRIDEGMDAMMDIAINGKGAMPPRGASQANDDELKAAVLYMVHETDPDAMEKLVPSADSSADADQGDDGEADDEKADGDEKADSDEKADGDEKSDDAKTAVASGSDLDAGKELYEATCAACHGTGAAGAPKVGDKDDWASRIDEGMGAMMDIAINGKGAMPPRGGSQADDDELEAAVLYMVHETDPDAVEKLAASADSSDADEADDEKADGDDKKADDDDKADDAKTASFEPDLDAGKELYEATCAACHGTGTAGAPKLGDKGDWEPRIEEGMGAMMTIALNGKGAMPARGGAADADDDTLKNAVLYMVHEADPDAMDALDLDDNGSGAEGDGDEKAAEDAKDDDGKTDTAAGEKAYKQTCAACHGDDGNSTVPEQPNLAQQHPEYTAKQLHQFKDGKRKDAIMEGMAKGLSDGDIRNISAWLYTQEAKPGFAEDEELAEAGQKIYRGGLADRSIASCAACHSPNGAGMPAQYPRLAGQFAQYTAKQLKAFRDGSRTNSDVMHDIAVYMTDAEIDAVSDFIAGMR